MHSWDVIVCPIWILMLYGPDATFLFDGMGCE
jgi:hypothetical protein